MGGNFIFIYKICYSHFPLELFSFQFPLWLMRYTSEYRLKIGVFAQTDSVWPKVSGRMDPSAPTILRVRKLG